MNDAFNVSSLQSLSSRRRGTDRAAVERMCEQRRLRRGLKTI